MGKRYEFDPLTIYTVDEKGCWIYQGRKDTYGYGQVWWRDKEWRAHRMFYMYHKGEIPAGLFACHKCDNPPCVNPDHIFLGTNNDNVQDCVRKGRQRSSRGVKHHSAKLTPHQVVEARMRHFCGETTASLASAYGIVESAMYKILRRITWKTAEQDMFSDSAAASDKELKND